MKKASSINSSKTYKESVKMPKKKMKPYPSKGKKKPKKKY